MNLYIKQRVFSFGDKFHVYGDDGEEKYYVEGEAFSFGKKLHLFDMNGRRLADINQKLLSFYPRYYVTTCENRTFEIVKHFTFLRHVYEVNPFGWLVQGDFYDHSYEISNGEEVIIGVQRQWFTFGDAYQIYIKDGIDVVSALSIVLVIDACIEQENNN